MGVICSAPETTEGTTSAFPLTPDAPVIKKERSHQPREEQQSNISFVEPETPLDIEPTQEGDPCGLFVSGLSFHWMPQKFNNFLNKIEVKCSHAIKKKSQSSAVIFFDNEEDRKDAFAKLSTVRIGQRRLFVVPLKRDSDVNDNAVRRLKARAESNLKERSVVQRVTPWVHVPYAEQLSRKSAKYSEIIRPIVGKQPLEIIPAPRLSNYRNNVEFTVGYNLDEKLVVGFNLGSRMEDVIAEVDECPNVQPIAVKLAREFAEFIPQTGLEPFDRIQKKGVWKFIKIRTNAKDESMLVVVTYGHIEEPVVEQITARFASEVTSLYLIETTALEAYGTNFNQRLLAGVPTIVETLRGLQFDISPLSFFQTNTSGAEVLFSKVEELINIDKDTVVVDVCCGTGVIGLSLAQKAKMVVGIDIEEQSITNAIKNAERNNITNAEFICSPAEKSLKDVLEKYAGSKIVCIVDPPRGGLMKKALCALRDCADLHTLVYVSCNPASLVDNAQRVLMSEGMHSPPYRPVSWVGVDMVPHTDRLELVMLMER